MSTTASLSGQKPSKPGISFPHCAPVSPSLLIFPLCARPGHLCRHVKARVKSKKVSAALVIRIMPGGLVGQGAEFSRSSCVLVELTVRQPKRVSISPLLSLSHSPPPLPFPSIGMLGLVPRLTQTHTQPEISAPHSNPLPPPPSLNLSLCLNREASITPDDIGSFPPPAHSSQRGGQGGGEGGRGVKTGRLLLLLCDYIITDQQTCIQYIKQTCH